MNQNKVLFEGLTVMQWFLSCLQFWECLLPCWCYFSLRHHFWWQSNSSRVMVQAHCPSEYDAAAPAGHEEGHGEWELFCTAHHTGLEHWGAYSLLEMLLTFNELWIIMTIYFIIIMTSSLPPIRIPNFVELNSQPSFKTSHHACFSFLLHIQLIIYFEINE